MHHGFDLLVPVVVIAAAALLAGLARARRWSEPLVLTIAGMAASFVPVVPEVSLDPQVILVGVLPPLLYTAAINTSVVDFKANRRAIGMLAVGLVIFTTFTVAFVLWSLLDIPFAIAVAFGAVVAPPDAVAASAVARRVGMPRRIVTVLEGESLVNDATALVTLRTALGAIGGTVGVWQVGADFALATVGGALVGLIAAVVLAKLRRLITESVLDTTLSFVAPFVAYLPAEHFGASGVIAVVTCGLILGHAAPRLQSPSSRVAERVNWNTIQFILESAVFLLIGLQVRSIVGNAWNSDIDHLLLIGTCVAVLSAAIVARPVWIVGFGNLQRLLPERIAARTWPIKHQIVMSWAGMRGVVTLAAVLMLPSDTQYLDVLKLLALVVVFGTLVLQGTTLPMLMKALDLRGPSAAEDALQEAALLQRCGAAGLARLDEVDTSNIPESVIDELTTRVARRNNLYWERLGTSDAERSTPSEDYRRLRLQMLDAERALLLDVRSTGDSDHEVVRTVLAALDVEESMLERIQVMQDGVDTDLTAARGGGCDHLTDAPVTRHPDACGECSDCRREDLMWVHLRMCLTCGHVACCSSSVGNHAEKHYAQTGHPVMRSLEPGEAWRWCYPDELLG